jgi:hypothetical protein
VIVHAVLEWQKVLSHAGWRFLRTKLDKMLFATASSD